MQALTKVLIVGTDSSLVDQVRDALSAYDDYELQFESSLTDGVQRLMATAHDVGFVEESLCDEPGCKDLQLPWFMLTRVSTDELEQRCLALGGAGVVCLGDASVDALQRRIRFAMNVLKAQRQGRADNRSGTRFRVGQDILDPPLISGLFSQLAHDFRTPLNSISMWTGLLRTTDVPQSLIDKGLEAIEAGVAAQVQLLEELLDIDRVLRTTMAPETVVKTSIPWLPLLEAVRLQVQRLADRKGVSIGTDAGRLNEVFAERLRIERVVANLLLQCVSKNINGGRIAVDSEVDGGWARIEIDSKGPGGGHDQRPAAGQGPGGKIGGRVSGRDRRLFIAQQFVEQLDGRLDIIMGEDVDLKFVLRLPLGK